MDVLEKKDWYVLGTGVLLGIVTAVATQLGYLGMELELLLGYAMAIPILPALVFLYLARKLWGGDVARYLDFIAVGLIINLLMFPVHLQWHMAEMTAGALPAWGGLSPNFWYLFFHGLTAYSFVMLSYGFYLFWKSGVNR